MVISYEKNILFDYLLENSQDIITLTDINFNYIFVSRTFLKLYNFFHISQVTGKNIKDILPSECSDVISEKYNTILQTREPLTFTYKLNLNNHETILKQISVPVVEEGEIKGFLSVSRDITNEENLKLKLFEKVYQLNSLLENEKKLKAQKEIFMATLTHDLKNPVQAQLMSLKLLKNGIININEQKEIVSELLESSNYMNEMLCSILNTYKFDNGIIELEKNLFDASILLKKCITEIKALAKNRNIKINYFYTNLKIFADETQLRRVISNILNNALHYGYKNSELNINLKKENNLAKISFENSTDTIPNKIKEHIFDKYVTKNKLSGAGLGLYFSKKVVEAHNGKIYLIPSKNKNKFVFEIPIKNNLTKASIDW